MDPPKGGDCGQERGEDPECVLGGRPGRCGAPLSRLQTQGARLGRRGSSAAGRAGGKGGTEGRGGLESLSRGRGGDSAGDARPGPQRPQYASVSRSPWVSCHGALPAGGPATPSSRAPSAPCCTPRPDTAHAGGEPGTPGLGWGLGRDLGSLPSLPLSAPQQRDPTVLLTWYGALTRGQAFS